MHLKDIHGLLAGFHICAILKSHWPNKEEVNMPKLLEPLLAGRKEEDEGNLKSRHLKTCRTRQSEPAEAQVLSHPNLIKSDFRFP
jgi:hypothetical protein